MLPTNGIINPNHFWLYDGRDGTSGYAPRNVVSKVIKTVPKADLDKLVIPEPTHAELSGEVAAAAAAIGDSSLAFFAEFAFGLDQTMADVGFDNLCLQFYDDAVFVC